MVNPLAIEAVVVPQRYEDDDRQRSAGTPTRNLVAPIDIIPTVVLMRDGPDIDRLVRYTGPEIMSAVGKLLGDTPSTQTRNSPANGPKLNLRSIARLAQQLGEFAVEGRQIALDELCG